MTMKTKQEANTGSDVPTCSAISDTDRLDWLQNKQKTAWRIEHEEWRDTTEFPFRRERVTVFEGWAVQPFIRRTPISCHRQQLKTPMSETETLLPVGSDNLCSSRHLPVISSES